MISTAFADIFYNNALKNSLLPVTVQPEAYRRLLDLLAETPLAELGINLAQQQVIMPDGGTIDFPIDGFAKTCLLNGVDELGYLLGLEEKIQAYEQALSV